MGKNWRKPAWRERIRVFWWFSWKVKWNVAWFNWTSLYSSKTSKVFQREKGIIATRWVCTCSWLCRELFVCGARKMLHKDFTETIVRQPYTHSFYIMLILLLEKYVTNSMSVSVPNHMVHDTVTVDPATRKVCHKSYACVST